MGAQLPRNPVGFPYESHLGKRPVLIERRIRGVDFRRNLPNDVSRVSRE